jgi:hypothetical protein
LEEGSGCPWEKEKVIFVSRTKIPCLQEGAGCPCEKEMVIFGSAGLKFHVCRKELAAPGRRRGSALVVQD